MLCLNAIQKHPNSDFSAVGPVYTNAENLVLIKYKFKKKILKLTFRRRSEEAYGLRECDRRRVEAFRLLSNENDLARRWRNVLVWFGLGFFFVSLSFDFTKFLLSAIYIFGLFLDIFFSQYFFLVS